MTPEQALREAHEGRLRPVYLLLGEESFLARRVYAAIRARAVVGPTAAFNEDRFHAGEAGAEAVLGAARTLPMMAATRFVAVHGVERWETRGASALDLVADYVASPVLTTVMVLVAEKLHAQRRVVTLAKKGGFVVECAAPPRRELGAFVREAAQRRGHAMAHDVAELVAEFSAGELGALDDAVERLSLYVGAGAPITEDAVTEVVARVRQGTVWQLVDALCRTDIGATLATFDAAFDEREGGLRMLGALGWNVRQLVKFEGARRAGAGEVQAAAAAGVAPFRAADLGRAVKRIGRERLGRWLGLLSEADLALKGSRRPDRAVLETLLIDMCR